MTKRQILEELKRDELIAAEPPDDVRDEVLVRLLELNAERAREEARAGLTKAKKRAGRRGKKRAAGPASQGELFS